jgi:hypothetical protein
VVQYFDGDTKQRASAWGLGTAARQGWLKTLQVLELNYQCDRGLWGGLDEVCKAFDNKLTQLSHQHATPVSSSWAKALEALETFHALGCCSYVSTMLERALLRGFQPLVRQFMELRDAGEKRHHVALVAGKYGNVVLLRWLFATGVPIGTSFANEIATEHVEVAGYLSEGDRVQAVCTAITKKWHKLLQWTLENTRFNDDSSRATIAKAVKQAPSDTVKWLRENLTNAEARKWCLPPHKRQRVN